MRPAACTIENRLELADTKRRNDRLRAGRDPGREQRAARIHLVLPTRIAERTHDPAESEEKAARSARARAR